LWRNNEEEPDSQTKERDMPSATAATMIKMLETLPEQLQDRVLEHMREYVEDIREEARWSESFSKTQGKLVTAARETRKAIDEGKAAPLDIEKL
jgi:MoxR-like ATPase